MALSCPLFPLPSPLFPPLLSFPPFLLFPISPYLTLPNQLSNIIFTAYNYACDVTASNDADLAKAGNAAAAAIKAVNGKTFTTGPGCPGLYATSGESSDYHYDVIKATYSYTVELRDTGTYGFVLPANQITPSGLETFAGVKALLVNMK